MTLAPPLNCETVRESFRAWNAERESLDSELSESLRALEAYQLHLDNWQQQLAHERKELQSAREQFESDQSATDKNHADSSAAAMAELNAAREKITALTTLLLSRTEELRTLDNRRAEIQTELELSRAKERELKATIEDGQRLADQERSQWADELKHLREVLVQELQTPNVDEPAAVVDPQIPPILAPTAPANAPPANNGGQCKNPVLGSVVEQFGKLRQQRAVERQAQKGQR